jgi:hypothetical protein
MVTNGDQIMIWKEMAMADLKDSPSYGIQLEADEDQKMNVSWLPVV